MSESWLPSFKDKCQRLGIKGGLFDKDDTLFKTSEFYEQKKAEFCNFAYPFLQELESSLTTDILFAKFREAYRLAYLAKGADPIAWVHAIQLLADDYEERASKGFVYKNLLQGLPILFEIYQTVPDVYEGAVETLQTFDQAGLKTAAVTLADKNWTDKKVARLAKDHTFAHVTSVDVTYADNQKATKNAADWAKTAKILNLDPSQVVVIGDSLTSDIIPAYEAGVIYKILLSNDFMVNQTTKKVPPNTLVVKNGIRNLIATFVKDNKW